MDYPLYPPQAIKATRELIILWLFFSQGNSALLTLAMLGESELAVKVLITTVELWFILIRSIVVAERSHAKERNRPVRWIELFWRCWRTRQLLARIVRGDPTLVKRWTVDWDDTPYLTSVYRKLTFPNLGASRTIPWELLDVVAETPTIEDWYYLHIEWDGQSIPAPWVNKMYNL